MYWVVRKVRADFEGKLKRRRFKFSIYLLNLNLLRHELSGQFNMTRSIPIIHLIIYLIENYKK